MAKWHGFGRCKTRLSKDIGKSNSAKVQSVMTKHTISVAKSLQKNKLIYISIAISGLGRKNCKKWGERVPCGSPSKNKTGSGFSLIRCSAGQEKKKRQVGALWRGAMCCFAGD